MLHHYEVPESALRDTYACSKLHLSVERILPEMRKKYESLRR